MRDGQDMRAEQVPEGWQVATLGEHIERMVGGGTPARDEARFWGGGIPWASVKDLTSTLPEKTAETITSDGLLNSSSHLIPRGTVILATRMAVGKAVRFPMDISINQDLRAIFPKQSLNADFLHILMLKNEKYLKSVATGTTVKGVRQEIIQSLPILLPPLAEQRRIAEILGSVDEAIAATQALIDQTRTVKQTLLQHLLTKGIGHARFKQTEIGEIPEAWEVVSISSVLDDTRYGLNTTLTSEPIGVPVLRMGNIIDCNLDFSNLKYARISTHDKEVYSIKKGDILFNRTNSRDLVGKIAISNDSIDFVFASYLIRLRVNRKICNPWFLHAVLSSDRYQVILRDIATPGASQANINVKKMGKLELALPSLREQDEIFSKIEKIINAQKANAEKLSRLFELKSALLADLLSGRTRVPVEPQ